MSAKIVAAVSLVLLVVFHAQLWTGEGGVRSVSELQEKLNQQHAQNAEARLLNEQMRSELNDLQEGLGIVEERARAELGMVKPNEIYVSVLPR